MNFKIALALLFLIGAAFADDVASATADAAAASAAEASVDGLSANGNDNLNNLDVAIVGTGAGATYVAWRLAAWMNNPGKIRMFEKLNRIGGRAHHITSADVPQLGPLEINLGAYRFNEVEHVAIKGVMDELQIPTRCYNLNNVVGQTTNCPTSDTTHVFTRGVFLTPAQQANSANWPYNLEGISWTALSQRPSIDGAAMALAFPFATTTWYPDLTNPNAALRWAAVKTVLTRMQNCGSNPGPAPDCNVPGNNPVAISENDLIRGTFPEEYIRLNDVIGGNYLARSRHNSNMYNIAVNRIALGFGTGGGAYRVVMEGGGRHGYTEPNWRMIQNASAELGLTMNQFVKFGYQMHTIRKQGANKYKLFFTNGQTATASKVILNMAYNQFKRVLDQKDNLLYDNPPAITKALYGFGEELKISGTYLHYTDAWWIRQGFTTGRVVTEEVFKDLRFYHGHVVCAGPGNTNCHGLLFVSYQIQQSNVMEGIDADRSGPSDASNYYVLSNTDARDNHILQRLHNHVVRVVRNVPGMNVTGIPFPDYGVHANWVSDNWWKAGGVLPGVNNVPAGKFEQTALQPIPGEKIYMVNLDWMVNHAGDAEGAYCMAEKLVNRFFGLARPNFLENSWYDANIPFDT